MLHKKLTPLFIVSALLIGLAYFGSSTLAATNAGVLTMSHSVGDDEPLLGGTISFDITLGNNGSNPVTDKGYNVTISNTLPVSVTYTGATIAPTFVEEQDDGTILLVWDNIADIEVNEELGLTIYGSLDPCLLYTSPSPRDA